MDEKLKELILDLLTTIEEAIRDAEAKNNHRLAADLKFYRYSLHHYMRIIGEQTLSAVGESSPIAMLIEKLDNETRSLTPVEGKNEQQIIDALKLIADILCALLKLLRTENK